MIESEAVVTRLEQGHAWVRIRPHTPCGNCDPETGCKTVAMTRMFSGNNQEFRVRNPLEARVGDLVHVAIADGMLLSSALWGYGLPLGLMLVGATLGYFAFFGTNQDMGTLGGAGMGIVVAVLLLKSRRQLQHAEPSIVKKHEPGLPMLSSCKKTTHI
ncbi:MAG: SoxR reducing system RseC family protein [Formivibrio sp.]|nr:SoxR reducing system RseC family protein [Formivibrio sp.]